MCVKGALAWTICLSECLSAFAGLSVCVFETVTPSAFGTIVRNMGGTDVGRSIWSVYQCSSRSEKLIAGQLDRKGFAAAPMGDRTRGSSMGRHGTVRQTGRKFHRVLRVRQVLAR